MSVSPPVSPRPPAARAMGWGVALGVALGAGGWALLVASLPHGAWGLGGGQATAVASVTLTRGLWSDCATDASGVTSCVPLLSLITLPGLGALAAAAWFGAAITREFFDPRHGGVRYEPGPGLLLAAGGGALAAAGGAGLLCSARGPPQRPSAPRPSPPASAGAPYGRNAYV